jgi:hypothetical protein
MSASEVATYADHVAARVQTLAPGYDLFSSGNSGGTWETYLLHSSPCQNWKGLLPSWNDCADKIVGGLTDGATIGVGTGGQGNGGTGQGNGGTGGQSSSGTGGSGISTKRQPLGELISVNLELAGLQGQPVFLSWSIFQEGGQNHLSGSWLGNFVAYRLEGTTNDDTGTLEMWIPLPKQHGPYFVHLTLSTVGGDNLASKNSGPFD